MNDNSEKRAFDRRNCNASMEFSYFNQTKKYDAKVLNCGDGGMCFRSHILLQPGTTVCIRVIEFPIFDSLEDNFNCLRCMSLAEVKWCNELHDAESGAYGIGVKYQPPAC